MEPHLVFYVIAGLLLITEAFTPGTFIFVCFALATAITGLVDQFSDLNLVTLLAINLILSLILLFFIRPILKTIVKVPHEGDPNYASYAEKLIGREAMVFKEISKSEAGLVKLLDFDETWLARSLDSIEIGQGVTVKVARIDGNHLIVKAV
jgi:membrane protein implicated in regulation of membrane protease activity